MRRCRFAYKSFNDFQLISISEFVGAIENLVGFAFLLLVFFDRRFVSLSGFGRQKQDGSFLSA